MKTISLAVTISLILLGGCATQSQQARTEGTAAGAGIGALIGAGIGAAIGGGKGAAIGAGVGALLGGTAGYLYADNIDQEHQELLSKENDINGQIQVAQNINNQMVQANEQIGAQLASYNQEIATLEKKANYESSARDELMATKKKIQQDQANVNKTLASAKSTLVDLERMRNSNSTASTDLDNQITNLKATYSALENKSTELASLSQRI
jgi:outer membrane lipoprotein SlyB